MTYFLNDLEAMQKKSSGSPWRIAFISASILLLELTFIRLIPAEVRSISYFTNLIFIATFFGLGLGCICSTYRSFSWTLPTGLVLVFVFIFVARGIIIHEEAKEVHYWLQYQNIDGQAPHLSLFTAATVIFIFSALPFVAMGQKLAKTMDEYEKLVAYGWDIAGSLAGTIMFVISSQLYLAPWVWPPLIMTIWALLFITTRKGKLILTASGVIFLFLMSSPFPSAWSPYYYIQYNLENYGVRLWVNSSFHQMGIDFESSDPSLANLQTLMKEKWGLPYKLYKDLNNGIPPKKVLILGAGTGNDVNIALFNGIQEIHSVEIDPLILEQGKKHNPSHPYDNPKVSTYIDDARHYIKNTRDTFDMVLFGTLDSQILLNNQANLRLESYVYTRQSFEDVKSILSDKGMMVIYYSAFKPWIMNRLYSTVRSVFHDHTGMYFMNNNFLFNTILIGTKGISKYKSDPRQIEAYGNDIPTTDDWPFIYLKNPTIAPIYQKVFFVVLFLIAGVFILLRKIHPVTGLHMNFLFLGVGFTLIESSAIVRLALVFGNTWIINAIVFSSVLLTIFLANLAVIKRKAPGINTAWSILSLFILINYFFPIQYLFTFGTVSRIILCVLLIGIPVYCAAICFSYLFKEQKVTGYPLGVNLIGAMVGGIIEYISMVTGIRFVWVVVLIVYLLAWLSTIMINKSQITFPKAE